MGKAVEQIVEIINNFVKEEILSKEIIRDIPQARQVLNGGIGKYIIGAVIVFVLYLWITNIQYSLRKHALKKKITLKNAMKFYKILCRFGVSIQNHPNVWNELRSIFYNVNKSSLIPTELKVKLKTRLEKKGLVVGRIDVIDNYEYKTTKVSE